MDSLVSGKLSYVLLVGILDAAILSWLALFWFRRAVRRLMRRPAGDVTPGGAGIDRAGPRAGSSRRRGAGRPGLCDLRSRQRRRSVGPWHGVATPQRRRLLIVYGVAAGLHALVITAFQLGPEAEVSWISVVARWWVNTWPLVPALIVLLVLDWRQSLRLGGAFVAAGTVSIALLILASRGLRGTIDFVPVTNTYWLLLLLGYTAAAPLVLLLITGWRRIRAVAPLVLSTTLLFGFAVVLFQALMVHVFDLVPVRRVILGWSAYTSAVVTYYGLFMLLILPVGALAWWLLRGLAVAFQGKRFSDVQLMVDCWWVIVTAEEMAILSTQMGLGAIPVGIAAFLAYRAAVALGLRRQSSAPPATGRRLLFLRVFGYRARTEALLDRVAQRWRFDGPVQLVAGVDLATRTVDPGDFLAFIGGRLADQYVAGPEAVRARLEALDVAPDPDGRFRVNEFYCHDDTWRPTVQALLEASDRVLMDVRSFSERNQGCRFELEQLIWRLPSDAIVLVVDKGTDVVRLGDTLDGAWRAARASEPGARRRAARARPGGAGRAPRGAPHHGLPPGDGDPGARADGTRAGRGGALSALDGPKPPRRPAGAGHRRRRARPADQRGQVTGLPTPADRRSPPRSAERWPPRRT